MVKLTVDLIQMAFQRMNPVRDRELVLRGYKIPVLENLGATLDQFDTLDLSDNEIRKLDGFPLLKRIKAIILNNNRVVRIAETLHESIPNLETLILTNNNLQELADLEPLARFTSLETLSLIGNPVMTRANYRQYVIFLVPSLRVLDFRRVRLKERLEARRMFKTVVKSRQENGKTAKTFVPGAGLAAKSASSAPGGPSAEQTRLIKEAIARATSLQEIERLNQILRSGIVPGTDILDAITSGGDAPSHGL